MVEACRPESLQEALEIRSGGNTIVLAGGSDLMVRHRRWSGLVPGFPQPVLFVGHLKELQGIDLDSQVLRIGAAVTLAQLLENELVPDYVKLPVSQMASPAVRNTATIGGNVCNSSPAGDTLPMLYALDARLTVRSKDKGFHFGIADFITGPGQNRLKPDELVTEIEIPLLDGCRCCYKKVGSRKANSVAKASFFGMARSDTVHVHEVRFAFGAVAPTVVRCTEAEDLLRGIKRSRVPELLPEVKSLISGQINPIDDQRSTREYRLRVSLRMLENFLLKYV